MSGDEDDFLTEMMGKAPSEPANEAEPVSEEAQKVEAVAEVPQEPEAPKVEPTSTESDSGKNVPLAALMAEREKRQEATRKADDLEKRIKELEQQTKAEPAPLPDFFQNPEAYVQSAIQQAQRQAQDGLYAALEEAERERHTDFDEVMQFVMEQARVNPAIAAEVLQGKNPAAQAYKVGKRLQDYEKSKQDPESFRAQIEAEVRERLKKEMELEGLKKEREKAVEASIPPDLSSERSANGQFTPRRTSSVVDTLFPKT